MLQDKDELLRELIEKYARMYMKLAYSNGVPFSDTEDVVMDAFWAFYRSKDFGKKGEAENKLILACIVKHKCIDYYRKNSRYNVVSLEDEPHHEELMENRFGKDPLEQMIEDEDYRTVRGQLDNLKEIWREAAVMYFVEGRKEPEISKVLGISGTVCRSRISRVRQHLRETLKRN